LTDKPFDRDKLILDMENSFLHSFALWNSMNEIREVLKDDDFLDELEGISVKDLVSRLRCIDYNTTLHTEWFPMMTAWAISILPKSMTEHKVNPRLTFMIKLFRFYYEIGGTDEMKKRKPNLSFDDLSKIFMRSKSTIHEVMKDYDEFKSRLLANEQPK
jgi:hypothetical protein